MRKRLFDLIVSLLAVIVLSPLLLAVSGLIMLKTGRPILYRGKRVGKDGVNFYMYKFRTMVPNAERMGGPSTALNDQRLTSLGKTLRKYKLDELPQFFNVLKGDMSLIGPRPQVERYTMLYTEEEKRILSVRPGITDYASIRLIHLDSLLGSEDVDEKYLREIEPLKNALRLKYVDECSFRTDMKILLLTFLQFTKIKTLWNTES